MGIFYCHLIYFYTFSNTCHWLSNFKIKEELKQVNKNILNELVTIANKPEVNNSEILKVIEMPTMTDGKKNKNNGLRVVI